MVMADDFPLKFTGRIDYDGITAEFSELKPRIDSVADLDSFIGLIMPLFRKMVVRYEILLLDDHYVEGEVASLMWHLVSCVNTMLPKNLGYKASLDEEGQLLFKQERDSAMPN